MSEYPSPLPFLTSSDLPFFFPSKVMAGHREGSMYKELKRVIPTPPRLPSEEPFSGCCLLLLICWAAIGSGTGILMAIVTTIYSCEGTSVIYTVVMCLTCFSVLRTQTGRLAFGNQVDRRWQRLVICYNRVSCSTHASRISSKTSLEALIYVRYCRLADRHAVAVSGRLIL